MVVGGGAVLEDGDGHVVRVHPGVGATAGGGDSVGHVGCDARGVDKVGEVARTLGDGFGFPDAAADEDDKLAEDGELKLELDAVDDSLDHGLHDVLVFELDGQQGDVHGDDDEVDDDELVHDLALAFVRVESQHARGLPDIETRKDELLDAEAGHLDLLHDVVAGGVVGAPRFRSHVGAVGQNGGGEVEDDGVNHDHGEDGAENAPGGHNQVQTRVQDDGLAGDHAPPADGEESHGQPDLGINEFEKLEEEAD